MGGLGSVAFAPGDGERLAHAGRGAQRGAGAGLPGQPVRRLEPRSKARASGASSSRSAPARRARSPRRSRCSPSCGYRDRGDARRAGARGRPRAAGPVHRQGAARLRARARALTVVLTPTPAWPARRRWWRACSRWRCTRRTSSASRSSASSTAAARAPLPPPAPDGVEAMGRTNDAILYGGRVHLDVRGRRRGAARLASELPSLNSRDYGAPFAASSRTAGYDFYKIDPRCSRRPRCGSATSTAGDTWHGGRLDMRAAARPVAPGSPERGCARVAQ